MDAIPVTKPTVLEHDIPGTPKLTWVSSNIIYPLTAPGYFVNPLTSV